MPFPFLVVPVLAYLGKKLIDYLEEDNQTYTPPEPIIEDRICFIGSTNSGKSSTANAILGYEAFETGIQHGVQTESIEHDYEYDYKIVDTPGLYDTVDYEWEVITQARKSKIIVYVVTGELYEPELDFMRTLDNYIKSHILLLYVNKQDEKENYMTKASRLKEQQLIIGQVSSWIPKEQIAFGSSSPKKNGKNLKPEIEDLKVLIYKHM